MSTAETSPRMIPVEKVQVGDVRIGGMPVLTAKHCPKTVHLVCGPRTTPPLALDGTDERIEYGRMVVALLTDAEFARRTA